MDENPAAPTALTNENPSASAAAPAASLVLPMAGAAPAVPDSAWVAPGAVLVGAVTLGDEASVWYTAVLRADGDAIAVGRGSNVQDGAVLHADPGYPVRIGDDATVGHRAIVHGATVGDGTLIGMGAILLNGAEIGAGCLVAAGSLIPEGFTAPPGVLLVGAPAKVRRELTEEEAADLASNAADYRRNAARHRDLSPASRE
ncbi:carbonic anhydrase/acetyltransferase-like protein (isoleucine patch superfamily) [Murinocardiopsis flavida]|uniref:Carbonic anhydrase/acetyltransferase-like protein (Isoleucine patch superfamily) n=1 Tax=Murinocardiopsis flavida TaxID=645275 RepID=A0A2P8CLW1_9ACTN|nr:gamma carbonic anhydrase family protein [Murinocardiopsis flavida]PSK85964.1 carbonic anhydrase/acetyltransferase-like protein (isoleucine patch superfamily) [Murinocardiopsis flavida]